jgi:hypothetical protein
VPSLSRVLLLLLLHLVCLLQRGVSRASEQLSSHGQDAWSDWASITDDVLSRQWLQENVAFSKDMLLAASERFLPSFQQVMGADLPCVVLDGRLCVTAATVAASQVC